MICYRSKEASIQTTCQYWPGSTSLLKWVWDEEQSAHVRVPEWDSPTHAHRVNIDRQYHSPILYLADSTICAVRLTRPSTLISILYIPNSQGFMPTLYIKSTGQRLLPQLFVLHAQPLRWAGHWPSHILYTNTTYRWYTHRWIIYSYSCCTRNRWDSIHTVYS